MPLPKSISQKSSKTRFPNFWGLLLHHLLQCNLFEFSQSRIPDQSKDSEIIKLYYEVMKTQKNMGQTRPQLIYVLLQLMYQ